MEYPSEYTVHTCSTCGHKWRVFEDETNHGCMECYFRKEDKIDSQASQIKRLKKQVAKLKKPKKK